ncbi:MAG: hypothetical protein ABI823_02255 [Bryobacteraceae bacterium]
MVAAFAIGLGSLYWYQGHYPSQARELMACLPSDESTHVWIDVDGLRRAGILDLVGGSKIAQEAEYTQFVEQSGFDFRRDLRSIAAAFAPAGTYYAIRGQFDWAKLTAYATSHGGTCQDRSCSLQGSTPERMISFRPLNSGLMALAVSKDASAVSRIALRRPASGGTQPGQPIWVDVPSSILRDANGLPAGTKSFATILSNAQKIEFSAGPRDKRLELVVAVTCANAAEAAALTSDLSKTTDLLRKMMERDGQKPSPRDLSGILVAGTFRNEDRRVFGSWPVERAFVESLAGGDAR